MTADTAQALNNISRILTNADCCHVDESSILDDTIDRMHNSFIISRQAVQDKLLSPLIDTVEKYRRAASDDFDQLQNRSEITSGQQSQSVCKSQDRMQVSLEKQRSEDLRLQQALENLRAVIITEKEAIDDARSKKRERPDENEDGDE
jgi:hypothetical protein